MKKFIVLVLMLSLVAGLAACTKPMPQDPTTTPTTAPTAPSVPTFSQEYTQLDMTSKEGVPAFFKLLTEQFPDGVDGKTPTTEEDCYNITPPGADVKTDLQVFLSVKKRYAFIVQDGRITAAVNGITSLALCDLDGDEKKDVLMTTLWGSGSTVSYVYMYSSATKKITTVYTGNIYYYPSKVLWVAASGADVHFEGKTDADNSIQYPVLCLEAVYENYKIVGYVVTGIVGNVVYKDGAYQFVPYKK